MEHIPPSPGPCPACGLTLPAPGAVDRCPRCGLPLAGEVALELRQIGHALARLDAERGRLLWRRAQLLSGLRPMVPPAPVWGVRPGPARETSPPTAQNLLLSLGGVLLTVAATAFTVVSWGHLGIGGRATVLGALTLAAMAVPALLLRRALSATAEVVACLGLVLLLLDAYAVHQVAFTDANGASYAAAALAVVSAVWAAYGRIPRLRRLVLPCPTAVVIAQLPLPLWAAAHGTAYGLAAAALATATLDAALSAGVARVTATGHVRATAGALGALTGMAGLVLATTLSVGADGFGPAARAGALLLAGAAVALATSHRLVVSGGGTARGAAPTADAGRPGTVSPDAGPAPGAADGSFAGPFAGSSAGPMDGSSSGTLAGASGMAVALGAVAGLAVVAALGGLLRPLMPHGWHVPGYLLCAMAVLALAAGLSRADGPPRPPAVGLAVAAAAVHGLAGLWAVPSLAVAVFGPLGWLDAVWSGAPDAGRAAVSPLHGWIGPPSTVAVAAVLAAVCTAAAGWRGASPRRYADAAACSAIVLAAVAGAALPATLDVPYPMAVWLRLGLVAVLLAAAMRDGVRGGAALGTAGAMAVTALAWALAERPLTFAALGVLLGAFAVAGAVRGGAVRRAAGAAAAVVCAAGLAWAGPLAVGWPAHRAAPPVLVVAAVALLLARLAGPGPVRRGAAAPDRPGALSAPQGSSGQALALECSGWAAAALAVVLSAADAPSLALVLALTGVLTAGVALRADRRGAGYAATALLVAATWVRLAASGVSVPEAYTMPVTAAALVVGGLRRRRDPSASSWTAYGPGLSVTLLPSLAAAWGDPHWLRPLLLGSAALVLTLLGARHRLRAPLLLGGVALALDALHELAPYVVQVVGAAPRWLPLALAGALLLVVGATYEQRLRDVRRVRDVLRRMH